jgi:hypothetical protein
MSQIKWRRLVRSLRRGDDELAFQLGVSPGELKLWMLGLALPPDSVFLRVVDISRGALDCYEKKN